MMCTSSPCVFGASLRAAPYETPFPARRSKPSTARRRHATPHATHDRSRLEDVAAVEEHAAALGVDPLDRARDEDLRAEPAGLLERAARQLLARDARGKAEVVLDPRRGAGLPAGRLALDHDRP